MSRFLLLFPFVYASYSMTHPKPGRVTSCLVEVRVRVSPTCGLAVDEACKYACVSLLVAAAQRQVFLTLTGAPSNRKTNH